MCRSFIIAGVATFLVAHHVDLVDAQVAAPVVSPQPSLAAPDDLRSAGHAELAPVYDIETGSWNAFDQPGQPQVTDVENGTQPDAPAQDTAKQQQQAAQQESEKKKAEQKRADKKKKEKQAKLKKAAASAYKPLFYDNDFSFLLDPAYEGYFLGDGFKQITCAESCHCGAGCSSASPCSSCAARHSSHAKQAATLDIGGQYRYRYHNEQNMRGLGLTGRDDRFLLQRTRLFANLRFGKRLRFYAEYIDAVSGNERFVPRPIEENRSDIQNLFVDGTLLDFGERKLKGRIGRQEMLYGVQRLITPLDWANTRLRFDGGKLMYEGKHFDVDGFWMQPVFPNTRHFDNPISEQQFYGIYSSYKGLEQEKLESYWLAFDDDVTGFRADSIGGRWYGEDDGWLAELWGNYQFGTNRDNSSHSAGAWTVGLGRKSDRGWKPKLWVFYDWASGDGSAPGAGNGYFQFFPLAHKYLGFMDFYGRRNIESPNVQFSIQPTEKLTILAWYYYFFLQDRRDTPYTVVMTPFAPGVTPGSADLGNELDLIATYKLTPRSAMLLGYSHFFSGAYYDTPGLPFNGDANFYYVQYQFNF